MRRNYKIKWFERERFSFIRGIKKSAVTHYCEVHQGGKFLRKFNNAITRSRSNWSATLNGEVLGTRRTAQQAKSLIENRIHSMLRGTVDA